MNRLYILNGCADFSRSAIHDLLRPDLCIEAGIMVGESSAEEAKRTSPPKNNHLKPLKVKSIFKGVPGTSSENLRPVNILKLNPGQMVLPVTEEYDIVITGGGTAGTSAAISAARHGMKVLVLEYLDGLGGMGTMGMIGRYWDGYREGFTKEIDEGVARMGPINHQQQEKRKDEWFVEWKKEWFRREIKKAGGEIWFGAIGCGAFFFK